MRADRIRWLADLNGGVALILLVSLAREVPDNTSDEETWETGGPGEDAGLPIGRVMKHRHKAQQRRPPFARTGMLLQTADNRRAETVLAVFFMPTAAWR